MSSPTVTPPLQRLAAPAAHDPDRVCPPLAALMATDVLREAYHHTSQARAAGLDGVMAPHSAAPLDEPLRDLYARRRGGGSQAAPGARVGIAKDDGGQRPMGKPTGEDTRVQRAVAMLLAAIDAHDFSDGSSGLRPGRRPHKALQELRERGMQEGRGWIVEADVRGSCDRLARTRLRAGLRQRVKEGRRVRLMGPWLRAGVMEAGVLHHPDTGVGQGGTLSPVLANILLHQVREAWGEQEVQPRLKGRSFLIRFADDGVIGCARAADARKIRAVLPKRWARDGLTLPPTQTAVLACGKPAGRSGADPRTSPGDLLGLTHDWTTSRRGCWGIKRRTASKRLRRTKQSVWRWCRPNRHAPLQDQDPMRCLKWRGHVQDDGSQGTCRLLEEVRRSAEQAWRSWLRRRSSKSASGWAKVPQRLEPYVLPTPRIVPTI